MKVVKGSDLVNLFESMYGLGDLVRFMSIRSATHHALEHGNVEEYRELLEGWMKLTEPPTVDDVAPGSTNAPPTRT